jgi:hypothetical protein
LEDRDSEERDRLGSDKGKLEYWKEIGMAEIGRRKVLERFKGKGEL